MEPENTEERGEALVREARARLEAARAVEHGSWRRVRRGASSGPRLRTLLLSGFAIFAMVHLGSRAGAPLGVRAAFTPSRGGESFVGPRHIGADEVLAEGETIQLTPGDVIGVLGGAGGAVTMGGGRVELEPGARLVAASLMPPRVQLRGGRVTVTGRLRVVTPNGIVDGASGAVCHLSLGNEGLVVRTAEGQVTVTDSAGVHEVPAGDERRFR